MFCSDLTEKKSKKEGIYEYVKLIHFAVHPKLIQRCKATISG